MDPVRVTQSLRPVTLVYRFAVRGRESRAFSVHLNRQTLQLVPAKRETLPEWTRLGYEQCAGCPLAAERHPHCPVAVNLIDVVEFFGDVQSIEIADIEIRLGERTSHGQTAVQEGIASIIGVIMSTSGCPTLDHLRPIAASPRAFTGEAASQLLSVYLLAQVLRHREGLEPDFALARLGEMVDATRAVLRGLIGRLRAAAAEDGLVNAFVRLDHIVAQLGDTWREHLLELLRGPFEAYLSPEQSET